MKNSTQKISLIVALILSAIAIIVGMCLIKNNDNYMLLSIYYTEATGEYGEYEAGLKGGYINIYENNEKLEVSSEDYHYLLKKNSNLSFSAVCEEGFGFAGFYSKPTFSRDSLLSNSPDYSPKTGSNKIYAKFGELVDLKFNVTTYDSNLSQEITTKQPLSKLLTQNEFRKIILANCSSSVAIHYENKSIGVKGNTTSVRDVLKIPNTQTVFTLKPTSIDAVGLVSYWSTTVKYQKPANMNSLYVIAEELQSNGSYSSEKTKLSITGTSATTKSFSCYGGCSYDSSWGAYMLDGDLGYVQIDTADGYRITSWTLSSGMWPSNFNFNNYITGQDPTSRYFTMALSNYGNVNGSYQYYSYTTTCYYIPVLSQNTYNIAFNANGGTGSMSTLTNRTYSTSYTLTANAFTRSGYTFLGWSTSSTATSATYANKASVSKLTGTHGATVTLYAVWKSDTYSLTVNPNGGTLNGTTSSATYSGATGSSKSIAVPTKEGYTFAGWAPTGSNYTSPSSITSMPGTLSSFGLALYQNADCSGDTIGGFSVYNNNSNGAVTHTRISDPSNPLGSGYSMQITTNGTATPDAGGYHQASSGVTAANQVFYQLIVAKIPKGYELLTARNGAGDNAVDSWYDFLTNTWITGANWASIASKSSCTLGTGDWKVYLYRCQAGSSGTFSSIGFKYLRATGSISGTTNTSVTWYVGYSQLFKVTAGTTSVTGIGNASTTVYIGNQNCTLKALWIPNTTLTINPNGGTWNSTTSSSTYTKHYGSTQTIADPTKTGYTFLGWLPTKTVTRKTTSGTTTDTWIQVFYHNNISGTVLFTTSDSLATNTVNTLEKFSLLNKLSQLATSSGYEFLLEFDQYPGVYNRWIQTSNPTTTTEPSSTTTAPGYQALSVSWTSNYWGGLGKSSTTSTFIDGSYGHGNWFYAIGSYAKHGNGIPSCSDVGGGSITGAVTLWLKVPNGNLSNFVNLTSSFVNADATGSDNTYYYRNGNINLQAIWQANTYTVKYNANGGSGTMSNSSHTYGTAKALTANSFTRTGYTFKGWGTSANATTVAYADKASVNNLTSTNGGTYNLYAIWQANTYTVKYNANGGSGTMSNSSHIYDTAKNLTANTFTIPGYGFLGWSEDSSATSPTYTDGQSVKNLTSTNGATINLYAVWKALNYTVNFYDGSLKLGSQTLNASESALLTPWATLLSSAGLTQGTYVANGWTFNGWSASSTATTKTYNNNQSVIDIAQPGGSIDLFAIYSQNLTLNYNGNTNTSGSVSSQTIALYMNSSSKTISTFATNLAVNTFNKTNYHFTQWAMDSVSGTKFNSGAAFTQSSITLTYNGTFSHTFYAIWEGNSYTINYYNGTTKVNSTSYKYGTSATLKSFASLNSAVLNLSYGWEFYGWINSTSSYTRLFADQVSITNINLGDNSEITEGQTISLYAIYVRTITFVSGLHTEPTTTTADQYWNTYSTAATNYSAVTATPPQGISGNGWTALGYRADIVADAATFNATNETTISPSVTTSQILYAIYSRTVTIEDFGQTSNKTQYYNSSGKISSITVD